MSWSGAGIGKYFLSIHDSFYDYIKRSQSKEYYENYKVTIYLKENGKDEEEIEIPLTLLGGKIKKLKKYYDIEFDINLSTLLFNILQERGIILHGIGQVNIHLEGINWKTYYLNSTTIGSDEIILTDKKPTNSFIIKNYDQLLWLWKNGIEFVQD